ncbi:MAG: pilin [Candidatus Magasanikbacteria bacterium]|nr:pilin [Candidatus Magasanikbacteria bacterium]
MFKVKALSGISALILSWSFLVPLPALADSYGISQTADQVNIENPNLLPKTVAGESTVPEVIGAIIGYALSLVGIVFFGLMLYAGVRWMIAMGNTEDVEKAKQTLEAAAIGLVIVLAAYVLTSEIFKVLSPATAPTDSAQLDAKLGQKLGEPVDCTNGQKELLESDVDCGGICSKKCEAGKHCSEGKDCLSGACLASRDPNNPGFICQ